MLPLVRSAHRAAACSWTKPASIKINLNEIPNLVMPSSIVMRWSVNTETIPTALKREAYRPYRQIPQTARVTARAKAPRLNMFILLTME